MKAKKRLRSRKDVTWKVRSRKEKNNSMLDQFQYKKRALVIKSTE